MPETSGTVWKVVLVGEALSSGDEWVHREQAYSSHAIVGGLVRGLQDRRL